MQVNQMSEKTKEEQGLAAKPDVPKKMNGKIVGIISGIAVVLIALIAGIGIYDTPSNRLSRQLDLGNRYLEERNYEQAIVEFDKAIAIDPMCVDAYLGKAEAFIGLGDLQSALDTLQTGYELTHDERLKSRSDEIETEIAQQRREEEEAQRAAEGADSLADAGTLSRSDSEDEEGAVAGERGEEAYPDKTNAEDEQDAPDSVEEQSGNSENGAWVDDLYRKMIDGDAEAVYAIIEEPDFIEKCSEFEHGDTVPGFCTEYGLLTGDGKKVGVIYSAAWDYCTVVHCIHDNKFIVKYCPRDVEAGDYYYSMDGYGKDWLVDNVYHEADGSVRELPPGAVLISLTIGVPEEYYE